MKDGRKVTASFEPLPADQKFQAIYSGELSNSATYPSSFAAIHKDKQKPKSNLNRVNVARKVLQFKTTISNRSMNTGYITAGVYPAMHLDLGLQKHD